MKVRNYLVGALAALVTLVSCQKEVEQLGFPKLTVDTDVITFGVKGGSQSIAVTSTRDWTADCSAEWLVISPEKGTYSMDPQPIKITVLENNGYDREATLKITINMTEKNVTIKQDGVKGSTEQLVLFYNNFDKEEATQTYGSGTSWPFLDQFEGWKNETGSGAANVTYSFKAVSARANSTSNSNYSDYEGSGSNNMFFGSNAYIAVKNIALNGNKDLKLTFGTEKYSQSLGSVFTPSEYHIYLSKDGSKWVELKDYTFAGGETEGRWNVATATFTVPSGTENLSICMKVDVASSYRMDDFKLEAATEAGTAVDFSKAVDMNFSDGTTGGGNEGGDTPGGEVTPPAGDYIYFNNYDKVVATKTNNKWPFLDQFEGWKNETGSGAANVTYTFSGISARANAESNGTYSDYTSASGKNNLFFGENAYIATRNIALNGAKDLVLTFVSEKSTYNNDAESVFKQSEFHIYLSNDGSKWVELTDYTFAGGDTPGRWNLATATFSVPANTANLSIAIKADVASVYRLDDLGLAVTTTAGTAVDFSNAVDMDFGSDSTGGGNEGGDTPGGEVTPPAGDYIYFNNYDKAEATKTYGSGTSWPFLDQFEGWKNETGSGAANVTYTFSGISARANAESNGTYSDYTSASGKNNLFFGANAYIATRNIALNGAKDLALTFVSEKSTYNNDAESVFKQSEFHIYLSNDGSKWVELTDYTFAGGDTPGRWNLATATFSVPANTANLSIAIKADVASVYRLDDLGLAVATTAGTAVDFSNAVDMDFGSDSTGGGNEGGDTPGGEVTPPAGPVTATVKEFLAAAEDDTWYKLTGTISNLTNTTFGNFNLVDETGTVLVYGLTKTQVDKNDQSFSQLGLKEGDVVTLIGKRTAFQGTPQVGGPAYYVSHEPGNEGGTTPPEGGDEGTTDSYEPSGITWTLGTNAYDNTKSQSATVNGKKVTNLLKLGKSKAGGTATMKIPAGTKKVGAYILAWKGNNNITLDFTVGGTAVAPQFTAKANAGATGNAPYTITLDETYYHEIEVNTTADVEVLLTSSERVLLIGLKAIK